MPQIQPVVLALPDDVTVTLNPVAFDGTRTSFADSASVSIAMKQRLTVKTRPASLNNSGHVVEAVFIAPITISTPDGCCPTTGAPPVSSFNLRFTRGTLASDAEAEHLLQELIAYVQTADFASLVKGSSYF